MKRLRVLLAIAWAGVFVASLKAATYEVAPRHPQASDDSPGTLDRPWKTLGKAAASAGPGDTVRVHSGVYREHVVIKTDGTADAPIRFEVAPLEYVVVTGADLLTDWRKADSDRPIYTVPWSHRFNTFSPTMTHPGDDYHRLIGRCEQVIVNGYLLRQVLDKAQLAPGTFFADATNKLLFAWDSANGDLNRAHTEASIRSEILQ
jgi:hypothetical protein